MWLLILAYAAAISTILWYSRAERDEYGFKYLASILWGATIMVFVDHVYGYLTEGGGFFDTSLDALVLGFTMLLVAILAWLLIVLVKDPRGILRRK
ncbi:hypothetical protein ACSU1N_06725 [Thermogladius sp. 4427co]|uniref:hypothetical protein n=1 Tax=Thermogladius sp. 4427co TaxID=3450718 RepID=UPI003F7B1EA7